MTKDSKYLNKKTLYTPRGMTLVEHRLLSITTYLQGVQRWLKGILRFACCSDNNF